MLVLHFQEGLTTCVYDGLHGYDNNWPEMNGIFMAKGPGELCYYNTYATIVNVISGEQNVVCIFVDMDCFLLWTSAAALRTLFSLQCTPYIYFYLLVCE